MSIRSVSVAVCLALTMVSGAAAGNGDAYKVSGGEVVVVCPLTVGGSFEAKTKNVAGEVLPAESGSPLRGALKVDLQTLETGIGIRDRHMRDNYLEVGKGPEFSVATIEEIKLDKLEGKTKFVGTLLLHGQRKPVTGTAELVQRNGQLHIQAQFPLRVSEFQIPAPTYMGVGVRDEIQIKVSMTATPVTDSGRQ